MGNKPSNQPSNIGKNPSNKHPDLDPDPKYDEDIIEQILKLKIASNRSEIKKAMDNVVNRRDINEITDYLSKPHPLTSSGSKDINTSQEIVEKKQNVDHMHKKKQINEFKEVKEDTNFMNRSKTLLFFEDRDAAEKEIKTSGGRITQVFGKYAFIVVWPSKLPKDFNLSYIISHLTHSGDEQSDMHSNISKKLTDHDNLLINGWRNYISREQNDINNNNKNNDKIGLKWDEKGFDKLGPQLSSRPPKTCEYMKDSIVIGICIVSGPGNLKFTNIEVHTTTHQCMQGLQFLAQRGGSFANIIWSHLIRQVSVTVDNVDKPTYPSDKIIREAALKALGYNSVSQYINAIKNFNNTTYSCVAFFYKYKLVHFASASINTTNSCVNMEYSNGPFGPQNIHSVFAHEICHIFGASDEYADSNCDDDPSGTLQVGNYNCNNCKIYDIKLPCLMKANTLTLCAWTRGQVGWEYFGWGRTIMNGLVPASTSHGVSMCEFQNTLYMVFNSNDTTNRILITGASEPNQIHSGAWSEAKQLNNTPASTNSTPTIVAFNNMLYCLFKSNDTTNRILITGTNDPLSENWPSAIPLNNAFTAGFYTAGGPSAILYQNSVFCLFKSNDVTNRILITATNDDPLSGNWFSPVTLNNEPISTNATPTLAIFKDNLYCCFRSNDATNRILITGTNTPLSENWPSAVSLNNLPESTSAAPVLVSFKKKLVCVFKSNDTSNVMLYSSTDEPLSSTWSGNEKINHVDSTSASPALATFQSNLVILAFKTNDTTNRIMVSCTKQP